MDKTAREHNKYDNKEGAKRGRGKGNNFVRTVQNNFGIRKQFKVDVCECECVCEKTMPLILSSKGNQRQIDKNTTLEMLFLTLSKRRNIKVDNKMT